MLKKFLDRFRPKRQTDPVFGDLLFMATPHPANSYWEGAGTFAATGDSVEFFVDAPDSGPGKEQYQFFEVLNRSWASIFEKIRPILETGWRESGRHAIEGGPRFRVSNISIPLREAHEIEWELGFMSPDDEREQLFTVSMQGWRPTGDLAIDG
jgi:hypothetical protein